MRSKRVLRPFLKKQLQRVRHVWELARSGFRVKCATGCSILSYRPRINTKVTGSTGEDRFQYFLRKYLTGRLPVKRALTLGCGSRELERGLPQYNFATQHDAFDLSDHAIQNAITKFSKDQFERKLDLPHRAR